MPMKDMPIWQFPLAAENQGPRPTALYPNLQYNEARLYWLNIKPLTMFVVPAQSRSAARPWARTDIDLLLDHEPFSDRLNK